MANKGRIENLKPYTKGDPRAVENGRKGGLNSKGWTQRRRNMVELANIMMNSKLDTNSSLKVKTLCNGLADEDTTVAAMVMAGQIQAAIKGSTKAFQALTELDEKASMRDEESTYELPARVIGKDFCDINRQIKPNTAYVFKGGRGGLKSSYIGFKVVELMMNNPELHACVTRQVVGTLKDSVYAQMQWCINELGLTEEFDFIKNPLEIRRKKTGQVIYFRGLDDETKLKSIKPTFGYIGILWKEEKDQMKGPEQERSVNQSVLRGGDITYDFSSYNPPKSKSNWVNQEELVPNDNRVLHESNYLNAPAEWLGIKFLQDAEHLKQVNPEAYEHEYMGIANGEGGQVFTQLEIRDLKEDEVATFDHIYQGVDWGIAPDPYVFIRLHYDQQTETIYFIDEYTCKGLDALNKNTAEWIYEKGYDDTLVTCDSAEKKSVMDYRSLGLNAKAATKGPGSVEYGMKWLIGRKLVIDPKRTPLVFQEFTKYEFARDSKGNIITGYPDKDNHTIDATRYALERYANKRYTTA